MGILSVRLGVERPKELPTRDGCGGKPATLAELSTHRKGSEHVGDENSGGGAKRLARCHAWGVENHYYGTAGPHPACPEEGDYGA